MEDQYRHGTRVMGESHGTSILTESQVREIKALLAEGFPKLWIAQLFGVQDGTIHFIAKGETWKHVK